MENCISQFFQNHGPKDQKERAEMFANILLKSKKWMKDRIISQYLLIVVFIMVSWTIKFHSTKKKLSNDATNLNQDIVFHGEASFT